MIGDVAIVADSLPGRGAKTTLNYFHIIRCGQMQRTEIVSGVRIEGPGREGHRMLADGDFERDARPDATRPALLPYAAMRLRRGFRSSIEFALLDRGQQGAAVRLELFALRRLPHSFEHSFEAVVIFLRDRDRTCGHGSAHN